jgi:hypothetical protein
VAWWKREAICAACRVKNSALLLTACIVFGVPPEDPVFYARTAFLRSRRFTMTHRTLRAGWSEGGQISGARNTAFKTP